MKYICSSFLFGLIAVQQDEAMLGMRGTIGTICVPGAPMGTRHGCIAELGSAMHCLPHVHYVSGSERFTGLRSKIETVHPVPPPI